MQISPVFYTTMFRISDNRQIKFEFSVSYDNNYSDNYSLFIAVYPIIKNGHACKIYVDFYDLNLINLKLQAFITKRISNNEVILLNRPKRKLIITNEDKINRLYFHGPEMSVSLDLTNYDLVILQNAIDSVKNNYSLITIFVYSSYIKWKTADYTQVQSTKKSSISEDSVNKEIPLIHNDKPNEIPDFILESVANDKKDSELNILESNKDKQSNEKPKNTFDLLEKLSESASAQDLQMKKSMSVISDDSKEINPLLSKLMNDLSTK